MKALASLASALLLLFLCTPLSAQRRTGGADVSTGGPVTDAAALLTAFDSSEYGLKFPAPPDLSLFTPDHPGKFKRNFGERQIVYMVNLMGGSGVVTVKYLPGASDADVAGFKKSVEGNPPQAKQPEYKKVSVASIKVGAAGDKDAVEYVYSVKDKDTVTTTRQVVFVHKGTGFIFTCMAPEKDFASLDKKSFQKLFSSLEFK